jgi:hypothetical protein
VRKTTRQQVKRVRQARQSGRGVAPTCVQGQTHPPVNLNLNCAWVYGRVELGGPNDGRSRSCGGRRASRWIWEWVLTRVFSEGRVGLLRALPPPFQPRQIVIPSECATMAEIRLMEIPVVLSPPPAICHAPAGGPGSSTTCPTYFMVCRCVRCKLGAPTTRQCVCVCVCPHGLSLLVPRMPISTCPIVRPGVVG